MPNTTRKAEPGRQWFILANGSRAQAYLESFGRSGVPLYVLYPPAGDAVVLPQLLTPTLVREALETLPPAASGG
jgi:thiol:disulfide interchange protein